MENKNNYEAGINDLENREFRQETKIEEQEIKPTSYPLGPRYTP